VRTDGQGEISPGAGPAFPALTPSTAGDNEAFVLAPAIRTAIDQEHTDAIHMLVLAFSADPVARWCYPEPDQYLTHFRPFIQQFGGRAFEHDTAYVADAMEGASLWFPPDVHVDGDAVEAIVRDTVGATRLTDMLRIFEEMDRYHPKDAHWYLSMIGVDPARQGHGVGSALLRHALARPDEDSLPAYLESSNAKNVPLYQRHGFEVIGEIQVGDAPPLWPMLRPAR
jgi:ribosomal protein S18 acetylase RimI-like enzyme